MQYLDSIIIHNFKSFKHANIKFSKGFNCIVGPNGSGKSNICDSLLFALGESSLKRMRVPNTSQLINSFAKPKKEDGVKRAYVKINIAGDSPTEVARIIKSNNKIGYRLNGNRATRQEIIDVLRVYKSEINDTNIIAQGEISYMINLNSKERRELIDVAAGIKEFNEKKETAMKELDKVEQKMNEARIVLNERKGFLDQLEKEKEDAEKYNELTENVKRISFTLLKNIEKQSESDFNSVIEKIRANEAKKKDSSQIVAELDVMLEKLTKEKEALSKSLNERSVELNGTNKILENINKDVAVKETESKSLKEKLSESEKQLEQYSKEKKKIKDQNFEESKKLTEMQKELDEKGKLLTSQEIYESSSAQISKISKNQKKIDELYSQEELFSKQFLQNKFEIENIESTTKVLSKDLESFSLSNDELLSNLNEKKEKIKISEDKKSKLEKELELKILALQKKKTEMDKLYVDQINLKEQIAMLGGTSDKLNNLLKKNITKGFYGRAYELCSFDSKFEFAVNASALSRLNYFVVDSAEIADEAISLIKSTQSGRASFIPIKDMSFKYKEENEKLNKLVDHIQFDKKFEKAFNYIFANTYIVENIEQAKKIGFGKGRFVTLDGELVEQSGIITGGSKKLLQSPALLESKLKNIESQQKDTLKEISEFESEITSKRKEIATYQTEILNHSIELKHIEKESNSLETEIKTKKQKFEDATEKIKQLQNVSKDIDNKRSALIQELNELKTENEKIYAATDSSPKDKTKMDKNELQKLKELRQEVEKIKIAIATISKEQEMKLSRLNEIENEVKSRNEQDKETMKKLAILDSEIMELSKNKKELQQKLGKSDVSSQEILKKLQQHDSHISKFAVDRGKNQSDLEKISRELIEQESRKVQIQTRINDVKAELLAYQNVEALQNNSADELEAKRTIAKNDLERLGAVNQRAPEMYDVKKRDVEEANGKLDVLGNEKDSIIAMISEIESKKLNIFNETLAGVNENFKKLYSYILEGSAQLQLENPKDPFNSGLAMTINSPKNKSSTVDSLSGGEKILVMLMLIFAIQTHDPMAFYIFDEIDISLDKENSKKLSRLMKEISKRSQVIVISHNDSLITAADAAIGVVNRNHESKVVGLQLTPTEIKAN